MRLFKEIEIPIDKMDEMIEAYMRHTNLYGYISIGTMKDILGIKRDEPNDNYYGYTRMYTPRIETTLIGYLIINDPLDLRDEGFLEDKTEKKKSDNHISLDDLEKKLKRVAAINDENGSGCDIMIFEECSELIKALTKYKRKKGSLDDIFEESVDVITTILCYWMCHYEYNDELNKKMIDQMNEKCDRAIKRFEESREV